MKHLMITTALVCAASGAAFADGLTYGSVEGTYYDIEDVDFQTLTGSADYVTGNLSFTGNAGYLTVEDLDVYALGFTAGYAITPGFTVYAAIDYIDFDSNFIDGDDTAYGLGVEYQGADFGVALDYRTWDDAGNDVLTLGGFYEFGASTAYAAYSDDDVFETYMLGYTYEADTWDVDVATTWAEDFDNGMTAIATSYDLNDAFTLGVSLVTYNEDFGDYGIATFGGSYNFTDTVSLEANYVTDFGYADDADGFGLALKWETGARRVRVLDQIDHLAEDTSPLYDLLDLQ